MSALTPGLSPDANNSGDAEFVVHFSPDRGNTLQSVQLGLALCDAVYQLSLSRMETPGAFYEYSRRFRGPFPSGWGPRALRGSDSNRLSGLDFESAARLDFLDSTALVSVVLSASSGSDIPEPELLALDPTGSFALRIRGIRRVVEDVKQAFHASLEREGPSETGHAPPIPLLAPSSEFLDPHRLDSEDEALLLQLRLIDGYSRFGRIRVE
jgi:hypothetical protein